MVADDELSEDYIVPSVFNRDVSQAVAAAVAMRPSAAGAVRSALDAHHGVAARSEQRANDIQ